MNNIIKLLVFCMSRMNIYIDKNVLLTFIIKIVIDYFYKHDIMIIRPDFVFSGRLIKKNFKMCFKSNSYKECIKSTFWMMNYSKLLTSDLDDGFLNSIDLSKEFKMFVLTKVITLKANLLKKNDDIFYVIKHPRYGASLSNRFNGLHKLIDLDKNNKIIKVIK